MKIPSRIQTIRRHITAFAYGIAIALGTVVSSTSADDTEVFFGQVSNDASSAGNSPNVMFIIDDSLSMLQKDDGQEGTRLARLRIAMNEIFSEMQDVNIGIMSLSGVQGGGPVRYPVTPIDQPVCLAGECDEVTVYSTIDDVDNDTEQLIDSGKMNDGGNDLSIGGMNSPAGRDQIVGLRFEEIGIPQGARITSAVIEMHAQKTNTGNGTITVWAEDTDNAEGFTDNDNNLSDRAETGQKVTYNPGPWTAGEDYETTDLSSVIQEVVNRDNWCGGNDLALMMTGTDSRTAMSLERVENSAQGKPVSLRVTYDSTQIPANQGCIYQTLVYQSTGSINDSQESVDSGHMFMSDSSMLIPTNGSDERITAIRFRDIDIKPYAEISDARVEFTVSSSGSGSPRIKINAEATGKPGRPRNRNKNLSKRTTTAANVLWEQSAVVDPGEKITTSDISSVVQEIVSRDGWASESAMFIFFENDGGVGYHDIDTFDSGANVAPRLYLRIKTSVGGLSQADGDAELTVRDELISLVDQLRTNYYTPMLGAQYEAAQYMIGGPVHYGRQRGAGVINSNFRVSHPDSYSGGQLYTPPGCKSYDPYAQVCRDEQILDDGDSVPTYNSPMLDSCQSNHIVILGDGAAAADRSRSRIHDLIGNSDCSTARAGSNNCGAALAKWLFDNDHAPHISGKQNVRTHTIAFNLAGSGADYYADIASAGGGDARSADSAAELVSAFSTIIDSTLEADTTFTAPGAAVNQLNRLSHREDVYFALFKPTDRPMWPGNLKRFKLGVNSDSSDATAEADILDANDELAVDSDSGFFKPTARSLWTHLDNDGNTTSDADGASTEKGGVAVRIGADGIEDRKLFTYTGDSTTIPTTGIQLSNGSYNLHEDNESITTDMLGISSISSASDRALYRDELLKWTRGLDRLDIDDDGDKAEPRRQMGDPLHSTPIIVNYRSNEDTDMEDTSMEDTSGEGTSGVDTSDDQSVIYISTNEGMLHAINSVDGNELWAFSPQELMQNHNEFFVNELLTNEQSRPYGMDGPMSVWRDETDNDHVVESGESVYIYGSMRRGGNNYYAFNVTDPDNPVLAWVIKGGTSGFEELGQSWSESTKTKMKIDGTVRDVLVFGAGYDTHQDPDPVKDTNGNTVTMDHSSDSTGRGLYVVDARTGEKLWSVAGPRSGAAISVAADQHFDAMTYSIPAGIRVIDIDADGLADQLYASDTGGQLWRFDVVGEGTSSSDLLTGGVFADLSTSADSGHRRFYSEPDVALIQQQGLTYMAVSIGSGWRAHPLNDVVNDAQYVIRLPAFGDAPQGYGIRQDSGTWRPITEDDLVQVNDTSPMGITSDYSNGWFLRLPDAGEKALARSLIFKNVVYFTTYVPDPVVDACSAGVGSGYVYALSIVDGMPVLDFDGDGSLENTYNNTEGSNKTSDDMRFELKHKGIPAQPNLLIAAGQDPELFIGTEKVSTPISNSTTRTFWVDTGAVEN